MNISLHDLCQIIRLIEWVLTFGGLQPEETEFYNSVMNALQPYNALQPTLQFLSSSTVVIPFNVMADVNSIIIKHGSNYRSTKNQENAKRFFENVGYNNPFA